MKKFIKKTVNSIRSAAIRLAATRRSGEGYIDTAVKILIAVVLGALLLAGLYALFGDVVMPTLNERMIHFSPARLLGLTLAAPFLLASKKGRGGMGDTFLIGASGFLLGFCRGIVGLTLALLLYCLFYLAIAALHKIRGQERPLESYPFAPFLAAGFFTAYII